MAGLYFVVGQVGWFACVLSAARGAPWIGAGCALLLIAAHLALASRADAELKLIASVASIGALWESALVQGGLLSYPHGMTLGHFAPYWIVALWALFAAQFNTTYRWLKSRIGLSAVLGAIAGPLSFHAGASLGAVRFDRPWAATLALAAGWSCLLPLIVVLSRRWDGIGPGSGPTLRPRPSA
jgi:hypothetical protein